jgi:hypothetical protein
VRFSKSKKYTNEEREQYAKDVIDIVFEASREVLPDEQNAILTYLTLRVLQPVDTKDDYINELKKGNSPKFMFDNSGIIRVQYHNSSLKMVDEDGKKMPSKFKDKTVEEVWNEKNMEETYGKRLEPLMKKLNL